MQEKNYGENLLGFVIRIISRTELIINVGQDILTVGDKIQIYEPGDELFDLDGKNLGIFEKAKAELTVIQTSNNYSICSDTYKETVSIFDPIGNTFTKTRIITNNLNVREDDIKPLHTQFTPTINIGDPVKKV